ncbi:MAG: hypothetical protein U0350_14565 [Caldilineaceae bacterium]
MRWPCPACGTQLKFSWRRRLRITLVAVVAIGIATLLALLLVETFNLPALPVIIVVYLLVAVPLLLLDGVEVA